MIFFTSDLHFWHKGVVKLSGRPFENVENMNETLIRNWNRVVPMRGETYVLGDIFLCSRTRALEIRERLNGRIYLIEGNHDATALQIPQAFEWIKGLHYLRYNGRKIMLCHYPMQSWRSSNHGSWHLHGHCHGATSGGFPKNRGYRLDVGVDCWDYYPVSFNVVEREMLKKGPGLEIDHHKEE